MVGSTSGSHLLLGTSYGLTIAAVVMYVREKNTNDATKGMSNEEIEAQLGPWVSLDRRRFKQLRKSAIPLGPSITGRLADNGFCGFNEVQLSRLPQEERGSSDWSTLMGVVRPSSPSGNAALGKSLKDENTTIRVTKLGDFVWENVALESLTLLDTKLCIKISRATLMTLFAVTNARPIFSYSSACGYRSAYPSYCGQWGISWPNGKPCVVSLAAHDSHSKQTDVYPSSFLVRVDKCIEMLAGIVSAGANWKLAFPGRSKGKGPWILRERKKGFPGAHGSRHLYNMMGGKVYEVDLLVLVEFCGEDAGEILVLQVPCLAEDGNSAHIYVRDHEKSLLAQTLDYLPWSALSWSMHRGLRDILLAFGQRVMDAYRNLLAAKLKNAIRDFETALIARGWDADFVRGPMGEMAESSVMAGGGNSGDLVRVVVAAAEVLLEHSKVVDGAPMSKDLTTFWRGETKDPEENKQDLGADEVVALTKFFVLEWSQELDYQLYHQLPVSVYMT